MTFNAQAHEVFTARIAVETQSIIMPAFTPIKAALTVTNAHIGVTAWMRIIVQSAVMRKDEFVIAFLQIARVDALSIPAAGQHFLSVLTVSQRMAVDQHLHGRIPRAVIRIHIKKELGALHLTRIEMETDARPFSRTQRIVHPSLDAALVCYKIRRCQTDTATRLCINKSISCPSAKIGERYLLHSVCLP